jgi:hypothetical protein
MDWDSLIEVEGVQVKLSELHSILLENLTRDDLEEFAGEMIKFAVMEPVHLGEEL